MKAYVCIRAALRGSVHGQPVERLGGEVHTVRTER